MRGPARRYFRLLKLLCCCSRRQQVLFRSFSKNFHGNQFRQGKLARNFVAKNFSIAQFSLAVMQQEKFRAYLAIFITCCSANYCITSFHGLENAGRESCDFRELFTSGKFTKKIKFSIGVDHRFSLQFSTDHRNSGTFGSLAHQFRDTLATDCPDFLTFFSFSILISAATWKTLLSFREENWKWKTNFQSRFMSRIFAREFSQLHRHTRNLLCSKENSLREISPADCGVGLDTCALPPALCLFWFSRITPQTFSDGNVPNRWKTAVNFPPKHLVPAREVATCSRNPYWFSRFPSAHSTAALNLSINRELKSRLVWWMMDYAAISIISR